MATTTQTSSSQYPPEVQEAINRLITTSEGITATPYQPYTGSRLAGLTGEQQQGIGQLAWYHDAGLDEVQQARNYTEEASQRLPNTDLSGYMNPYLEAAIRPAQREIDRTYANNINQLGAAGARNNAFGGSRQALLESQANRNYMEETGDLWARGMAQGYNQGIANLFQDRGLQLSAGSQLAGLGQTRQQLGLTGAQALLQAGGINQAFNQAGLDTAYNDFLEQRQWPYRQAEFLSGIIRGTPLNTTTTSSTQTPNPNPWSQALGAGIGIVGLGSQLGLF